MTLRHVQIDLRAPGPPASAANATSSAPGAASGQMRVKRLQSDAEILAWYARLQKYHETQLTAKELGLPERDWYTIEQETNAKGRVVKRRVEKYVGTRAAERRLRGAGRRGQGARRQRALATPAQTLRVNSRSMAASMTSPHRL